MKFWLIGLVCVLAAGDLAPALETYLWGWDRLKGFVAGSEELRQYQLLDLLSQGKGNTSEFDSLLLKCDKDTDEYRTLRLRSLFRKWETTSSPSQKFTLLDEISRYLGGFYPKGVRPSTHSYSEQIPSVLPFFEPFYPSKVYVALYDFNRLPSAAYLTLHVSQMSTDVLFQYMRKGLIPETPNLPEVLVKKSVPFDQIEAYLPDMTLEQLAQYSRLQPKVKSQCSFADAWLRKRHPVNTRNYEDMQKSLRAVLSDRNFTCKWLEKEVLFKLLTLGLYTSSMSESEFQQYLPLRMEIFSGSNRNSEYIRQISTLIPILPEENVIREYEDRFLADESIDTSHYINLYGNMTIFRGKTARAALLAGKSCSDSRLPGSFTEDLALSRELEFERSNPLQFTIQDGVSLKIRRKNIPKITVKVIFIDAERYYRTHFAPIPTDFPLDGVEGILETTIETPQNSLLRLSEAVHFPELAGQEGLFVIEAMGGGRHARVWVQKGGLERVIVDSEEGYKVYIYSKEGQLLKSNHTGLILDGHIHWQKDDSDFVLIPWPEAKISQTLVLLHGNLAQFAGNWQFAPPNFELRAGFHLESEALRPKQRSFAVITPQLYLNGQIWPLSSLGVLRTRVTVEGANEQKIIVAESQIEAISGTFSVPFDLPQEFYSLEIEVSAELKSMPEFRLSTKKTVDLTIENSRFADLYLRKTAEEYQLHVLGKNGEELSGMIAEITISLIYWTEEITDQLASDQKGVIHLGKLEAVSSLKAELRGNMRKWELESPFGRVSYPERITMRPTDSVQIPVLGTGPVFLLFLTDTVVSCTRLPIHPLTNTVELQSLEPGNYQLRLSSASSRVSISIEVLSGVFLPPHYVYTSSDITSLTQSLPLAISTFEVRKKSVKIQLSGQCRNAQLAVSLRQFVGTGTSRWSDFTGMKVDEYGKYPSLDSKAKYLDSRVLDEEYLYVMDRKKARDKRGIAFPQPSLLVHPELVRGSVTEEQIPNPGTAFQRTGTNSASARDRSYRRNLESADSSSGHFLDFLAEPALVLTNLRVDENCSATIGITQLRKYGLVEVIAWGNGTVASRTEPVPDFTFEKRHLELAQALPEGGFAETRTMKVQRKEEKRLSNPGENADSISINSLGKLLEVLQNYQPGLSQWMFLSDWGLKSVSEKLDLYEKHASNELNFFLYHKDSAFFSTHIRPLVTAKMDKTLVDDIVLDRPLDRYLAFPRVWSLSALDKALLARYDPRLAVLLQEQSTANPVLVSTLKELFDYVFKDSRVGATIGSDKERLYYEDEMMETMMGGDGVGEDLLLIEPEFRHTLHRDLSKGRSSANEYKENQYRAEEGRKIDFGFWAAAAEARAPFLTDLVLFAHNNLREALLAVALVDLPWTTQAAVEFGGLGNAETESILLRRAIESVNSRLDERVSVAQFYLQSGSEAKKLVKGRKYTSKVVISNLSQQPFTLEVLQQVPAGSVSLHHRGSFLSNLLSFSPYTMQSLTYDFYFPAAGNFTHAGINIVQGEVVLQRTPQRQLVVLEEEEFEEDQDSFQAAAGNLTAVLHFLTSRNIQKLDWTPALWMLGDLHAFLAVTETLRNRCIYVPEVWAYSLQHRTQKELSEFLSSDSAIRKAVGPNFYSSLISTGKENFQYFEYFPLYNPRWHPLQGHSRIANRDFRASYENFLKYLAYKNKIDLEDRLILAQYFIMQHRYEEAEYQIAQISPRESEESDLKMQYDYFSAFLNYSKAGDFQRKYQETASAHWRGKWEEMAKETETRQGYFETDLMSVELQDSTLSIYSEGLAKCELKMHKIDLELLFSRSPFLKTSAVASTYTAPTFAASISLVSGFAVKYILPESLQLANVMLSLDCGNHSWSGLYAKSDLRVQIYSSKGLIRVTNSSLEGVPNAYVKVYSKDAAGRVSFYKDGYTDPSGKFDYSSVTSDERSEIAAFSLLVFDEQLGSKVVEIGT